MSRFLRYFGAALAAINANKLRSGLTMLGIIIGVAAVLITLGIGAGASASITEDITSQGTNLLELSPGADGRLTMADYRILADPAQFPEITVALAAVSGSSRLVAGDESSDGSINGVQANYADVKNLDVAYGRFLNSVEEEGQARVGVMGSQLTEDLFGSVNPLGKEVRIGNDIFTVIGVLESSGGNRFSSTDTQAFVPLSVAQSRLFTIDRYRGEAQLSSISVQVASSDLIDATEAKIEQTLRLLHGIASGDDSDFTIFNQASLLDLASQVTGTLSLFLGSIGAVSLLVGGIGIMNIMLVSVTERTKEIGLRRALGAQDGDILLQFLIESTVLCLLGGFIGLGISYGLAWLLSQLPAFTFQLIIDSSSVILALSVCSAAGFVFGLYPALRAMRLDPMEALRYE
jgi:putative ABC transport system permease protein